MCLSLAEQMHTGGLESILHHGRKWSNQKQGKKHSVDLQWTFAGSEEGQASSIYRRHAHSEKLIKHVKSGRGKKHKEGGK
jgi:hypothetical protein